MIPRDEILKGAQFTGSAFILLVKSGDFRKARDSPSRTAVWRRRSCMAGCCGSCRAAEALVQQLRRSGHTVSGLKLSHTSLSHQDVTAMLRDDICQFRAIKI